MSEPKLLVVEDEPEIASALATYGRARGFIVNTADNGYRALEEIAAIRPDVILLDISIPGIDGRDVLARAREQGLAKETVVIFVTARDEQSDRLVGLELGADDYETKPLHLLMLFRKIEHLLEKKSGIVVSAKTATPARP